MSEPLPNRTSTKGMSQALTLLFAIAGGAAVGNLYWAQPLLADIAQEVDVSTASVGMLVTVTQLGYALGVLLLVPLGDTLDRRRLIPSIMLCSAVVLAACALAPTFTALLLSLGGLGLTTVAGQLLTPLAGDLADPTQRGRIVGTIVSGLLSGILLSRTISGVVADLFGWRAIFWIAAGITAVLAIALANFLPSDVPRKVITYRSLLISVPQVVRRHVAAQITLIIGAMAFSVFTMFWTGLTFLLTAAPFSYSTTQIGLVGLMGLAGALAARRAGALHDRGLSAHATGAALLLALVAIVISALWSTQIVGLLVAVLLIDIAIQAVNVLNQTRLLSIDPTSRSRLNTAFVASNFIGGAAGSALAGFLWSKGGWELLMTGAAILIACAVTVWAAGRKHLAIT